LASPSWVNRSPQARTVTTDTPTVAAIRAFATPSAAISNARTRVTCRCGAACDRDSTSNACRCAATLVFATMSETPAHTYQVLTKRARRLQRLDDLPWTNNIWMGVTVENADHLDRVDDLRASRAKVKFLSCEPLLGSLAGVDLSGIDWVIAGGESGPQHRPVNPDWIRELREACTESGTAFFFKQWGGASPVVAVAI